MLVQLGAVNGDCAAYLRKSGRFNGHYCTRYEESPYKAAPIHVRFFKIVWGVVACTEDPQNQILVDNMPRYGEFLTNAVPFRIDVKHF